MWLFHFRIDPYMIRNMNTKSLTPICCLLLIVAFAIGLVTWSSNDPSSSSSPSKEKIICDLISDVRFADFVSTTTTLNFGTDQGKHYYDEADFRYHSACKGWYSFREEQRAMDCAMLMGGSGEFIMTVLEPLDSVLTLKGCAPENGGGDAADMRLFLNDKLVAEEDLRRGTDIQVLRITIDGDDLIAGDNRFRIEVDDGIIFNLPDMPFPIRLSAVFASATLEPYARPNPAKPLVEPGSSDGKSSSLVHASGTRLDWFLLPRAGERLKGTVSVKGGPLKAMITMASHRGSSTPNETIKHNEFTAPLFSRIMTKDTGKVEVDLDLSPFSDQPCRISLVSGHPGAVRAGSYLRWESLRIIDGAEKSEAIEKDKDGATGTKGGKDIAGSRTADEARAKDVDSNGSSKPDMIVVLLDAASTFFFESLGGRANVTPAVDAFAKEAVLFPHAVTPAPYTLPAVGSIMTGQVPDRHGVVWNANREGMNLKLSSDTTTAASLVKSEGYATFAVVTNPNAAGLYGYSAGFDRYEELFSDPKLWDEGVAPAPAVEKTKELIRTHRQQSDAPFYIYLHLFQPHAPYTPPEEFVSQFADPDYKGVVDGRRPVIDGFKDKGEPQLVKEDFDQMRNLYAATLNYADRATGELFDWLRSEGIYDDALIVVCSDHGEAFGEHHSIEHGHHLYEEALRVPLLIKYPKSQHAGRKIEVAVSLTDLPHTLAAAAGADTSTLGTDGIDLTTQLANSVIRNSETGNFETGNSEIGNSITWPDRELSARSDVYKPSLSLRWRNYQFIYDTLNRRTELFHLLDDPRQQNNLANTHPVIAGYLRTRLCRYFIALEKEKKAELIKVEEGFITAIEQLGYTGGGEGAKDPAATGASLLPMGRR